MKVRIGITLRLSFQCQKLGGWAFQHVLIVSLVFFSLGPITRTSGQEPQDNNTTGLFNAVSLAQRRTIQTVPLWGGLISYINSKCVSKPMTIKLHHFEIPCEDCHGTDKLISPEKMQSENILQKKIDINRTCTSLYCHDYDKVLNHPVNVTVNDSISEDMPLDDLCITCLTCHNQPESLDLSGETTEEQRHYLRVPNGVDLCRSCYMKMMGSLRGQSHWQFSSLAHLGKINRHSSVNKNSEKTIGRIDNESRVCISCHQDITVTIPGDSETALQKRKNWLSMRDHPIGMEYSRIAMRKVSKHKYKFPLKNNERIRLFDGKLGCGSCYSLYSTEKDHLIQNNFRSALCFECHDI